ncbi:MAG: hypothetical protein AMXMBFR56_66210 [Polyangiaceae bacterium]
MSEHVIPAGNAKGTPLAQATERDLKYWNDRIARDLAEGTSRFPDRDRPLGEAIAAELARRAGGGAPAPAAPKPAAPAAAPSATLAKTAPSAAIGLVGATRDTNRINAQLLEMRAAYHLVAPATVCGSLPEGCEVAFSLVQVDARECYSVGGGKVGLDGTNLKQIGAAAGISWDDKDSRRLDDGSDSHYCHYVAVGYVRNFDGSLRKLTGTVEIDMRDGSPQVAAMQARAKTGSNFEAQLRDTRLFLLRHAETKAKLRAIADMGIKRSYTTDELKKPFAVARLMWTGQSDDPELRRLFALKQADAMIGGIAGLYGQQNAPPYATQPQAAPALAPPPQHAAPALHAPPPVGAVPRHDDAVTTEGEKVGSDPQASAEDY